MSESINFGQINISTDNAITGKLIAIKTGLTPISKRLLTKIIREKKTNIKFNNKKANCQLLTKITLHSAINETGSEKKNRCGLIEIFSIKKKS